MTDGPVLPPNPSRADLKAESDAATAKLAELSKAYAGPGPTATPKTPTEARARLNALTADREWAGKFEAGDVAARREFDALTTLAADAGPVDRLAAVLEGRAEPPMIETLMTGELSTRSLASAVEDLRQLGLSDGVIREAVEGSTVPRSVYVAAQNLQRQRSTDAEWTKRLLSGSAAERRKLTLLSIVLASEVNDAA